MESTCYSCEILIKLFVKYSNIKFTKIRLVGTELFNRTDGQTDREIDMTKIVARLEVLKRY